MLLGVLLGVAAGALWGLIYIAPLAVPEYNPVLVALSRFIAFGVISLPFLWVFRRELKAFTRADIWESFKLPLLGNVLFYCLLTICIRLAGAPLAGMFMAVIPVLVAIASNIRYAGSKSAVAWSKILPPLAVIFFGLIVANLTEFERAAAASIQSIKVSIIVLESCCVTKAQTPAPAYAIPIPKNAEKIVTSNS